MAVRLVTTIWLGLSWTGAATSAEGVCPAPSVVVLLRQPTTAKSPIAERERTDVRRVIRDSWTREVCGTERKIEPFHPPCQTEGRESAAHKMLFYRICPPLGFSPGRDGPSFGTCLCQWSTPSPTTAASSRNG